MSTAPATASRRRKGLQSWIAEQRIILIVTAALMATLAFRMGFNPPGGFWEKDNYPEGYWAGFSVLASKDPSGYMCFHLLNASVLSACVLVIIVLIFELDRRRIVFRIIVLFSLAFFMGGSGINYNLYFELQPSLTPRDIYAFTTIVLLAVAAVFVYDERQAWAWQRAED